MATVNDLRRAQEAVNLAYEEWNKIPNGEKTMDGFEKILRLKAVRDTIQKDLDEKES